jgi:formate dehydrogenase alpha subunit
VAVIFGRAVTQAANAEGTVAALANLALVSGALQGDNGGIFPVAEQGNALGLLAAGVCSAFLPGFQAAATGGANADRILAGIEAGTIKALYLAGCNPLVEFPANARWKAALVKLELLVVQDVLASELTAMAGVLLPGAAGAEKRGSVTALDGRISTLAKAVDPPGEARPDLAIFADLFTALSGKPAPSEATLRSELTGQSWPGAPASGSLKGATPALATPESAELQLLVGKCPFHFGSATASSAACLELAPEGVIFISPVDAARLGVAEGGQLKVTGPAGSATGKVLIRDKVPAGLLTASDNFADLNIQQIVPAGANCVAVTAAKA